MASQPTADPHAPASNRHLLEPMIAFDLDLLSVVAFVAIGRNNHDESPGFGGFVETLAPFLIGLLVAWLAGRVWRQPFAVSTGLVVWVGTVAIGMACRQVFFDEGTAVSFVVVTSLFLGACFNGWRLVARRVTR